MVKGVFRETRLRMRGCMSPIKDGATSPFLHSTSRMHLLLLVVVAVGFGTVRGNY